MCFAKSHIYLARKAAQKIKKSHTYSDSSQKGARVGCLVLVVFLLTQLFFFVPFRTTQTDSIHFLAITNGFGDETKH